MDQGSKTEKIYAIRPNKSQLKRDHEQVKKFVITLIEKTPQILKKMSLSDDIIDQIIIAQQIKGSAYRRQIKHIANQLVKLDPDIFEALQQGKLQQSASSSPKTLLVESVIVNLIEQKQGFLEQTLEKYPQLDRQKLRTLILAVRREEVKDGPSKTTKTLKSYLHQQIP